MTIGKREQIVIGVILTIIAIAVMHLFIFAPSAQRFKEAKANYEQTAERVRNLRVIRNPEELTAFNDTTNKLVNDLSQGMRDLQMDQPPAFIPPPPADQLQPPPDTPPDQIEAVRNGMRDQMRDSAQSTQTSMTLAQITRLQQNAAVEPKYSFFGPTGWKIPTELPPAMQTAQLWDMLTVIAQSRDTLNRLRTGTQAYTDLQNQYNYYLGQLGFDAKHVEKLKEYGEFVPLFYRLAFANLIMKQMPTNRPIVILQAILTQERLFEILEIKMPFDPIEGMDETRTYFAYEQLVNLNSLLELARRQNVADVTKVVMPAWGFLRQQDGLTAPDKTIPDLTTLGQDDQIVPASVTGTGMSTDQSGMPAGGMAPGFIPMFPPGGMPGMPGGGGDPNAPGGGDQGMAPGPVPGMGGPPGAMMPPGMFPGFGGGMFGQGGMGGAAQQKPADLFKPREKEIGYALPIKVTLRASNIDTWTYLYEVVRNQPLVELNRLQIKSLSETDPNNNNIEATVTYIFVPKLFETLDAVRKLLEEIEAGENSPPAGAMPGAMNGMPGPPGMPPGGMPPGMPPGGAPPGFPPPVPGGQ